MAVQVPDIRVPFLDPSGRVTREWYLALQSIATALGGIGATVGITDVQAFVASIQRPGTSGLAKAIAGARTLLAFPPKLPQNLSRFSIPQFKGVTVSFGAVTASQPLADLSQTWNNAAVNFTAYKANITDTASVIGSAIFDWQKNGVSTWKLDNNGNATLAYDKAGFTQFVAVNRSGTATATAGFRLDNGVITTGGLFCAGSGYAAVGIRVANVVALYSDQPEGLVFMAENAGGKIQWAVGGTALSMGLTVAGLAVVNGFGCNGKAAQTSVASGGAIGAYAAGPNGYSTGAQANAVWDQVIAIRTALVANGIMS